MDETRGGDGAVHSPRTQSQEPEDMAVYEKLEEKLNMLEKMTLAKGHELDEVIDQCPDQLSLDDNANLLPSGA